MKILTVDDSATIRKIIAGAASVMGFETMGAANAQEALNILEKETGGFPLFCSTSICPG